MDSDDTLHQINVNDSMPTFVPYVVISQHTIELLDQVSWKTDMMVIVDGVTMRQNVDYILSMIDRDRIVFNAPLVKEERTPRGNLPWYRKFEGGHKRRY